MWDISACQHEMACGKARAIKAIEASEMNSLKCCREIGEARINSFLDSASHFMVTKKLKHVYDRK